MSITQSMSTDINLSNQYVVFSRDQGVVLVRVLSKDTGQDRLPDAVFTFRPGDPQYDYWRERLDTQALSGEIV